MVEIVSDVEHRPGVLPLLQFALTELFERSDGRRLTRDGYAAIGGAIGALGRRADEAWRSLDAEEREIARHVLLDLVDLAESGVATGRRVPRAELELLAADGDDGRVGAVLDDLGRGGLLTFDLDPVTGAPTVEIAHEALLVHWSRLADWIDDLRDDLRLRRRLADATDEWEASGRSPGYLAGGTKLERFEAWAHGTRLHLTAGEQAYLAASAGERMRLRRRVRFVRSSIAAVVVIAFVLTGGLWAAVAGRAQAEQEQAAIASARELSVASIGASGDLRLLLALEAAVATVGRGYVVEEAYDALQWALQDARVPFPAADLPVGVRAAPDGPRGAFLLSPGELMRLASDAARRTLSPDECRAYLHADACPPVRPPAGDAALGVRTVNGVVPAESLAVGAMVGTTVRVLSELPTDVSPLLASVERSGITIRWTAGADGDLLAAADSSALPDVAIVARPSSAGTAARRGLLVDLAGRADLAAAGDAAGPYLMGLGRRSPATADDPSGQYGVPIAASVDGLLWYPVAAFAKAGYEAPATAAELDELVRRLRADGRVPWCFGVDASSPTETAAAAWVEALYLEDQGVTAYDRWAAGETPFETPAMHVAFEAFGRRLIGPGNVFRDLDSALLTPERIAALPMVATDPPGCWLYRGSSADVRGLAPRAASVPFPGEAASRPLLGRVYEVVALRDRPEVRRLVQALVGAEFATGLARSGCDAGIFALQGVMPADCASAVVAGTLRAAIADGTFRARAVDTVPGDVGPAFESDVAEYLRSSSITGVDSSLRGFSADDAWDEVTCRRLAVTRPAEHRSPPAKRSQSAGGEDRGTRRAAERPARTRRAGGANNDHDVLGDRPRRRRLRGQPRRDTDDADHAAAHRDRPRHAVRGRSGEPDRRQRPGHLRRLDVRLHRADRHPVPGQHDDRVRPRHLRQGRLDRHHRHQERHHGGPARRSGQPRRRRGHAVVRLPRQSHVLRGRRQGRVPRRALGHQPDGGPGGSGRQAVRHVPGDVPADAARPTRGRPNDPARRRGGHIADPEPRALTHPSTSWRAAAPTAISSPPATAPGLAVQAAAAMRPGRIRTT